MDVTNSGGYESSSLFLKYYRFLTISFVYPIFLEFFNILLESVPLDSGLHVLSGNGHNPVAIVFR